MILPALHAALAVGLVLSAPRSLRTTRWTLGVLWIGACASAAYLSRSTAGAALAWAAAFAPLLMAGVFERPAGPWAAFSLAFFPAQTGLAAAFERGPLLPTALLLNGHLGALTASRLLAALPPDDAAAARPWVVALALFMALASAVLALRETRPRRVLARLAAGQGALILAGLACGNAAAQAGALALGQASAVAMTMLAGVCASLESRVGAALERPGYLGLAAGAPRLATFFAVAALTLAGLPLTMGFPALELLLGGLFEVGPAGLALPVVSALNGFVVLRLFALLFWGPALDAARGMPDALPRERWFLSAAVLFLLFGGLFPSALLP
ncbi:MAG: hypothetical protein HYZ75_12470 [Elusimicrobia bacterium]|nr:hypothetical protein [Elusimicrobiota bacterium]